MSNQENLDTVKRLYAAFGAGDVSRLLGTLDTGVEWVVPEARHGRARPWFRWCRPPVVAQASRSPKQAQMRRLLRGCEVIAFDEAAAHAAGALLGKTCARDVVDASVAELSLRKQVDVVSDDADG